MFSNSISRIQYFPILTLAISLLIGGYFYNKTLDEWLTDIVSGYMFSIVDDVAHQIQTDKVHVYDLSPAQIAVFLDNLSQSSTTQRITIIHEDGSVLADTQLSTTEVKRLDNHANRPEIVEALSRGKGMSKRFSSTLDQNLFYVAKRFEIIDDEHHHSHTHHSSIYIVRMATPTIQLANMAQDLRFIIYILMAFSMLVLIASTVFSQKKIKQVIDEERSLQQSRIDKSTHEIELLRQLATTLAACTNINEAQSVVEDLMPRLLGKTNGCVSLMRDSGNLLEVNLDWGGDWIGEHLYAPHDCWAMRKGRYHLSHEANQHLVCKHMHGLDERTKTLCVPLTAHGNSVGILHLYYCDPDVVVDDEAKQLAFAIAEHLGLALANLRLQEELRSQAMRDPLTGLFNRRYFEEKFESEWSISAHSHTPISLLMFDLDHFKHFNDDFGHDAGDHVLKEISNLLLHAANENSHVCRLGGEEFAIICPNMAVLESIALAEIVVEQVSQLHLEHRGQSLGKLGISAGIATYPDIQVDEQEFIKIADMALYQAKDQGRSRAIHANQLEPKGEK
ncbi:diguanylate cyclase [Vibrio sp. SCSIO 43136]|uniref:sensor domain-containing diguanylate cyclase n=1 Tax=Vibrio sp. SCSIO 43136 TaxID=2819101 RepID=UPI002075C422|nr:diguanylate cyclase [Vibrio sp. SCSIO 43136]USD66961.1 diguanylate cyclase [Vibrio sp. SCSIO 43136]